MFPTGSMGFVAGFQIAVFAFVGIELVGTTAAEAKDPEKNLPKAINSIPVRILLFYVVALIVIISVTPWREFSRRRSPFVGMFTLAGLGIAAGVDQLRGADLRGVLGELGNLLDVPDGLRPRAGG